MHVCGLRKVENREEKNKMRERERGYTPWRIRVYAVFKVLKLFHRWMSNVSHCCVDDKVCLLGRKLREKKERRWKQKKKNSEQSKVQVYI